MRKLIFLLFCGLTISAITPIGRVSAQGTISDYTVVDTMISYPTIQSVFRNNIIATQYGREVLFLLYYAKKDHDTISVHCFNIDNYTDKPITIVHSGIAERLLGLYNYDFSCIAFNGKTLALSFNQIILLFEPVGDGTTYVFKKEIRTPHDFRYMEFMNEDTLLIADAYLNNRLTRRDVVISTLNITNGAYKSYRPQYDHPVMTLFRPFDFIDVNDNKIVFANRNKYSFMLLDSQLSIYDSVSREIKQWRPISKKEIKKALSVSKEPVDIIDVAHPFFWKSDKLNWIYWIDSSHIMTVCGHNLDKKLPQTIDMWVHKDGQWSLQLKDIKDDCFPNETTRPNMMDINFMERNKIVMFKDKLVKIDMWGTDIDPTKKLPPENVEQIKESLQHHKPYLRVTVYNHSLCQ